MRNLIIIGCLIVLLTGCANEQLYYHKQEVGRLQRENDRLQRAMMAGRDMLVCIADYRGCHSGQWGGRRNHEVKSALAKMDKVLQEANNGQK